MLSHTLNALEQNLPLGRAGSGRRRQSFMEGEKGGRNGQVVNFGQAFAVAK